ncbi:MAG: hypothetical protein HKM95_14070 [Inquilinus sp.]|nr:hypothetical protein [Inquilinus sp.]
MVDLTSVVGRTAGMLLRPLPTLEAHSRPVPPWTVVAREHVLPLLVASALVWALLTWLFRAHFEALGIPMPDSLPTMMAVVALRVVFQFSGLLAMAKIAAMVAGNLGGRDDFPAAYTLVALSLTPSMVGNALSPIPMIGGVTWLGGLIYGLTIFYRAMTGVIGVPTESRGKHLAFTLVITVLAMLMVIALLAPLFGGLLGPLL